MFRNVSKRLPLSFKSQNLNIKRGVITGPTKTGSSARSIKKTGSKTNNSDKNGKSSGSLFDSSFTFQLFLIVGAMGAGYTLGKTTVLTSPPATLFPAESVTPSELLVEFDKIDKEHESKQYDMFRRCILRILENKGIEVDMKHGKNEFLYEEKYCNKEISDIMNDEDGLGDVFFGKDPKKWEGKEFVWYPETTKDVSLILKNCNEFKVPVYTESSGIPPEGLVFKIDYSKFKNFINQDAKMITFGAGIYIEEMNQILKENGIENNSVNDALTATDLFLMKCGVKLSDFNSRLISNKIDKTSIAKIECVLPDGKILQINNTDVESDNYKLYEILSAGQDELGVITEFSFFKDQLSTDGKQNLLVIGSNDLSKLNDTIKEISQKLEGVKISFVDNHGCEEITETYGPYKTFAVLKLDDLKLYKLNKKFSKPSEESDATIKIGKFDVKDVGFPVGRGKTGEYFSDRVVEGNKVLLIKDDVTDSGEFRTYHSTTPVAESEYLDGKPEEQDREMYLRRALLRRLKLAVDSGRVLNRGLGVSVSYHDDKE